MKFGRFVSVVFAVSILVSFSLTPLGVRADDTPVVPDWMSGDLKYAEIPEPGDLLKCNNEVRLIAPIMPRIYAIAGDVNGYVQNVCIYKSKGFQYAQYHRDYYIDAARTTTLPERGVAFSVGDVDVMTPSLSLGNEYTTEQTYAGNDRQEFIDISPNNRYGDALKIYRDIPTLIHQTPFGSELKLPEHADFSLVNEDSVAISVKGVSVSNNGRWITFMIANVGLIRLDLDNFTTQRVSDYFPYSYPEPTVETSISDDGTVAVVGGYYAPFEIVQITDGCGRIDDIYKVEVAKPLGEKACPKRDVWSYVDSHSHEHRGYRYVRMDSTGRYFTYFDFDKWASISAPAPRLEYLAIGDSYASGEGDVSFDAIDHYLAGTNVYGDYRKNVPREVCHVSNRSYPMLLAKDLNVQHGLDMQSVACSGAIVGDIYSGDVNNGYIDVNYLGQMTRLPRFLSEEMAPRLTNIEGVDLLKTSALEAFIPGRVQQIEFVKRTRPKIITVMAGGNDLGFGDVLSSCMMNFDKKHFFADDCYYSSPHGQTVLANRISDKYEEFIGLYDALASASPGSKIYVVGYPQFMDANSDSCYEYANLYTRSERVAISDTIDYANAVIRSAASQAGVYYIDISDAMLGKSHCASGTGMTGVDDLLLNGLYTEAMKGVDSEKKFLLNGGILGGSIANNLFLGMYFAHKAELAADAITYSPRTIYQEITQQLLHPNALGHETIHHKISSSLGGGSLRIPTCNLTVVCPSGDESMPVAGDYMHNLITANAQKVDYGASISSGNRPVLNGAQVTPVVAKGIEAVIRYKSKPTIKIDGELDVNIHSTPEYLGKMEYLSDGIYELKTILPRQIPVGSHVIHIIGRTDVGEQVDIAQEIYLEGSDEDIDDDGLLDNDDTCAFTAPSHVDIDRDGISDNCDIDVSRTFDMPGTRLPESVPKTHILFKQSEHNILSLYVADASDVGSEVAQGGPTSSSVKLGVLGESRDDGAGDLRDRRQRDYLLALAGVMALAVLVWAIWKIIVNR